MKERLRVLCFLGLAWSLLAANHPALPSTKNSPQVAGQGSTNTFASLLFADDFERGSWRWSGDDDYEMRAEAANHMLHCEAASDAPMTCIARFAWDDYCAEVRVRVASGSAQIGIRWAESSGTVYSLSLQAGGGLHLAKWDGAAWTTLGTDPGPYPAGEWHILALEGEGSRLRAYVDGELRIEASDASYATGGVVLQTGFGEADFDDV